MAPIMNLAVPGCLLLILMFSLCGAIGQSDLPAGLVAKLLEEWQLQFPLVFVEDPAPFLHVSELWLTWVFLSGFEGNIP